MSSLRAKATIIFLREVRAFLVRASNHLAKVLSGSAPVIAGRVAVRQPVTHFGHSDRARPWLRVDGPARGISV
jgi:hypothetical protein